MKLEKLLESEKYVGIHTPRYEQFEKIINYIKNNGYSLFDISGIGVESFTNKSLWNQYKGLSVIDFNYISKICVIFNYTSYGYDTKYMGDIEL